MWRSLKESMAQIATDVIEAAEDLDTSQENSRDHERHSAQAFPAKRLSDVEPILPDNDDWQAHAGEHNAPGQGGPGSKGEHPKGPHKPSQQGSTRSPSSWLLQEKDEELQHLRAQNSLLAERIRALAAEQAGSRHVGVPSTGTNGIVAHSDPILIAEVKELKERLKAAEAQKQSELESLRQQHAHALQEVQIRADLQVASAAAAAMDSSLAATQAAPPDTGANAAPASTQAWVQRLAEKDQAHAKLQKAYASALRDMQDVRRQLDERKRETTRLARELADAHAAAQQEAAEKDKLKDEVERLSLGLNESQRSSRDRSALSADAERRLRQQLEEAGAHRDAAAAECQKLRADVARLVGEGAALKETNGRLTQEVATLQAAVAAKSAVLASDAATEERIHELEARLLLAEAAAVAATTASAGREGDTSAGAGASGTRPDRQQLEDTLEGQLAALRQRLMEVEAERDRSKRDLARLKKHLLDKEEEDAAKLTEEAARVSQLEATKEAHAVRLAELSAELEATRAELARARSSSNASSSELSSQITELTGHMRAMEALVSLRDTELANLQSALGQFYAESEMHEKVSAELQHAQATIAGLEKKLSAARTETAAAKESLEAMRKEVAQVAAHKETIRKLQEEGLALRRALERSMGRVHRITKDSDYLMDRRIVNKLVVTYFEKGHSKEVLALMSRMFGFTEDEKERVGLSGKGVGGRAGMLKGLVSMPQKLLASAVRGVTELSDAPAPDTDQSFMDLWVDFLIKEAGNDRTGGSVKDHPHNPASYSPSLLPRASSNLSNMSGDGDSHGGGGHRRSQDGRAASTSGDSQPPSPVRHGPPPASYPSSHASAGSANLPPPYPLSVEADRTMGFAIPPVTSSLSSHPAAPAVTGGVQRPGAVEVGAMYGAGGGHAGGAVMDHSPQHRTGRGPGSGSDAGLGVAGYAGGAVSLGVRRGSSPAMQELCLPSSSSANSSVAMWLDSGRPGLGKNGSSAHSSASSSSGLSGLNSTALEDISLHSPTPAQAASTHAATARGPQVPSARLGPAQTAVFHSAPSSR
eukprot:jgi/Mesvir1/27160/Mv20824-RA.1